MDKEKSYDDIKNKLDKEGSFTADLLEVVLDEVGKIDDC